MVQDSTKQVRSAQIPSADIAAQPVRDDSANASNTAQAAAEEECFRAVVDLREAAMKLDKHKFQEKAVFLECVNHKAILVPSGKAMSMFSAVTWIK